MVARSQEHVIMQSRLLVRPNFGACEEDVSLRLAEAS
jgi:hypothetical protein